MVLKTVGCVRTTLVGMVVAMLAGSLSLPAQAQSAPRKAAPPAARPAPPAPELPDDLKGVRGEWKRAGAGFACTVTPARQLSQELLLAVMARACMRLGPLVVGDPAATATTALGQPHRTLKQPQDKVAWIYFVGQREHYPYFVVTVAADRIVALQVTGDGTTTAPGYELSSVGLGAATDDLVKVFGQPSHFEPSELKGVELWTYPPHPFSFELKGGRVMSIRINQS
ncbi:hypothetical protein SSBR45G_60620 [Bradyrhizobium sp. SSBR45G]|uniref:hypothetical protein n=1 Tax=unclassified Bradyrhizobium TaxID=2631580 RepID=UPI002342B6A2|nr:MULTISPECIES: hypothetical protein [unclassified Bradyrhizobium]GLH81153.1 hypothetical protein SSBR45G_60620 [Bradyrhizobium sp. SSBR45G]GLH88554.1 hypothetical protein SSBR45R_60150 [Bradyrhizobium sp. SSBR45R]